MCTCAEMITVVIVVGIWGDKRLCVSHGLCDATVFVCVYCIYVCGRERDEEKEQADPVVIDCWTWLYSKSLSL